MALSSASLRAPFNAAASAPSHLRTAGGVLRRFARSLTLVALAAFAAGSASAQTPATPTANTYSTLAGGYAGTYTAGSVCGGTTSGSKFTSVDTYGNGCPGQYAKFGPSISGLGADGAGNVYLEDYSLGQVRKIDARSGIVSQVIGVTSTLCSSTPTAAGTIQDGLGAGCSFATAHGPAQSRGMTVDVYGNVIIAGYNASETTVLCQTVSPLCPNTAGRKQVGFYYRVAGCVATQGANATPSTASPAAYTAGDGTLASPFQNLAGDVTAWGLTGAAATTATVGGSGTCSAAVGELFGARNASADKYGNVIIADSSNSRYRIVLGPASYNSVTNPMFALIQLNPKYPTAHEGYIYPILGGFTVQNGVGAGNNVPAGNYLIPSASGGACTSSPATVNSTDAFGSGCYYFQTGKPASTSLSGTAVDSEGNVIFSDTGDSEIRVIYVGGTKMAAIILANTGATAVVGRVYAIQGNGTSTKSGTPYADVIAASVGASNTKTATDGSDNIYISDGSGVSVIDGNTGFLRRLLTSGGTLCSGGVAAAGPGAEVGDGCTSGKGQTFNSLASVGIGIAVDNGGNVYLGDSAGFVRKVLANTLYTTAVGSTFVQSIQFHMPVGTTAITPTLINASPGITLNASQPACTTYPTTTTPASDGTADCAVSMIFAPTSAGMQSATLQVVATGGAAATTLYSITGLATGPELVTDTAVPATSNFATFGTTGVPTSVAVDGGGNVYTIDTHATSVSMITPSGSVTTVGTSPSNANQVAVDPSGNVYVTATGTANITKFTLTGAAAYSTATFTASVNGTATAPQGIAFDAQGNMYVSDATSKNIYEFPKNSGLPQSGPVTLATGLSNPTALTIDGLGNVIVTDTSAVYSINASTGALSTIASASAGGVVLSGLTPTGVAADAGGNVYIQDSASKNVYEIPYQTYSGTKVTVYSGQTTPSGLGVDQKGNIFAADSGLATPSIIKVNRNAVSFAFPNASTTFTGVFTNAGNVNTTGYGFTNVTEFPYTPTTGCTNIDGTHGLTFGGACGFTVSPAYANGGLAVSNVTTPIPNANATVAITAYSIATNVVTFTTATQSPLLQPGQQITLSGFATSTFFNGQTVTVSNATAPTATTFTAAFTNANASATEAGVGTKTPADFPGSITFTGTEPSGASYTTTTAITTPASGPYTAAYTTSGTEISFTFTVTASDSTARTGDVVNVSIDGATAVPYTLAGAAPSTATVNVSGLLAGMHTIKATYPNQGSYTSSNTGLTNFTITSVSPTVTWTPGSTTQLYSAAFGAANLNATATYGGSAVPGIFVYTATIGGNTKTIHSGSFLGLGTYSLAVTFYPTDSTNYTTGTASVATYTVNQATTTATIGGTQNVVAASGGNYTSVQAAVTALGATGGSVYIQPGTYTGYISVYQPNVSLRGLGGDPTAVILTNEYGAFNGTGQQAYAGEFTPGNGNGSQLQTGSTVSTSDPGSATLAVLSGINTAIQAGGLIPTKFYAENLTVANTYNTDMTTTTTTYEPSANGTCTASAGPARNYADLYANSIQCASQAIAVVQMGDLAVYNNVYMTSLQDTLEADSPATKTVARQYYFRGKYTGQIDYVFGRGAASFDFPTFYSIPKTGFTSNGANVFAQQKDQLSGSANDFLSGYVTNGGVYTSYTTGMTNMYLGRPYGIYGTTILLNSRIDQVNPLGWQAFSGANLATATYTEFADLTYSDPATGTADPNGVIYNGLGNNIGSGVVGAREMISTNPGTLMANNNPPTSMTVPQAWTYLTNNFLGTTVTGGGPGGTTNWVPTAALATAVNAFVPASSPTAIANGASITILMHPQTPGLGGVSNGVYTIPTGTYTLFDNGTQIAAGNLDASGEATYTSSTLAGGAHAFTWSYGGDTNFAASTTGGGGTYNLTVSAATTTTSLSTSTPSVVYGAAVALTATVTPATGSITSDTAGVNLYIDGSTTAAQTVALSSGSAAFSVSGLSAGTHSFVAKYVGDSAFATSTSIALMTTVTQASLTVTGIGTDRKFNASNILSFSVAGYQNGDTAATVFATGPTPTTTGTRDAVAGNYPVNVSATLTSLGSTNYSVSYVAGSFNITGGAAQYILFPNLPNFPHGGSYQLAARASSGLPITYTVTAGAASVSGTVLTVTGTGTVTVQASSSADPTGDYVAATPVSRSFTAQ